MVEYLIKDSTLLGIAEAIRGKTGSKDTIAVKDMAAQIESITGGGGSADGCATVTFMNGNTELFSRPVYIGDDCPNPVDQNRIETPTKDSTAQYTYEYNGWSLTDGGDASASALTNVTEDRTVYAAFKATAREYTITWLDDDGTELNQTQVAYGTIPSYTPSKEGAAFGGWTPTPVAVTGDAIYTAAWVETVTILPEQTFIPIDDGSDGLYYSFAGLEEITAGNNYKITLNGVEQTFTAKTYYLQFNAWTSRTGFGEPWMNTLSGGNSLKDVRLNSSSGTRVTKGTGKFFIAKTLHSGQNFYGYFDSSYYAKTHTIKIERLP